MCSNSALLCRLYLRTTESSLVKNKTKALVHADPCAKKTPRKTVHGHRRTTATDIAFVACQDRTLPILRTLRETLLYCYNGCVLFFEPSHEHPTVEIKCSHYRGSYYKLKCTVTRPRSSTTISERKEGENCGHSNMLLHHLHTSLSALSMYHRTLFNWGLSPPPNCTASADKKRVCCYTLLYAFRIASILVAWFNR